MGQVCFNHFNPKSFHTYQPQIVRDTSNTITDILIIAGTIGAVLYILNRIDLKPTVTISKPAYKE